MKIFYISVFFLCMLAITGLAFRFFQGIDDDFPIWMKLVLGTGLALAILLLVLCIRRYVRGGTGPNDK